MKIADIVLVRSNTNEDFDLLISKLQSVFMEADAQDEPNKNITQGKQLNLNLRPQGGGKTAGQLSPSYDATKKRIQRQTKAVPTDQEVKDEMAKLSPKIDAILDRTAPEEDTQFETKIDRIINAIPDKFKKARYSLLRIRKLGIQNTTTQTVIMSVLMAILNRAVVEFGMDKGWSALGITVALEITLPAVAGYLYSWMQKAGTKKSFRNAIIGGTLGGLAALGTVGIFGK